MTALATVARPTALRGRPMHGSAMRRSLAIAGAAIALTALTAAPSALGDSHQPSFHQINLVSNEPGKAQIMDPNLVNPWGMSHGPNTPLWVSDNGRDVTTLYTASAGGTSVAAVPLVVGIPGGGAPTGQAFNDTSGFVVPGTTDPALFVFAGEDGDVSAWNLSVTPLTEAVPVGHVDGAVFKGLALVHSPFGPLLLLTDFHTNQVDVCDSTFQRLPAAGLFREHGLPAGYAPFNVAQIGDQVFVTYAVQDANREDDVAGPAHGIIDAYTTSGAFVRRFVSHSVLNSPWALLVAPETFGRF